MSRDFQTSNVIFTLPTDPAKVALIDKPLDELISAERTVPKKTNAQSSRKSLMKKTAAQRLRDLNRLRRQRQQRNAILRTVRTRTSKSRIQKTREQTSRVAQRTKRRLNQLSAVANVRLQRRIRTRQQRIMRRQGTRNRNEQNIDKDNNSPQLKISIVNDNVAPQQRRRSRFRNTQRNNQNVTFTVRNVNSNQRQSRIVVQKQPKRNTRRVVVQAQNSDDTKSTRMTLNERFGQTQQANGAFTSQRRVIRRGN
jgi:hypothetical protein